ncbi:MAG: pilus assembly protein [Methyloversatilis discipulorum]|uniref:pilus assembly PilX family protein n=1 Tax=Methyloversatilis discipulorum TaxID=1119528 RepID=UPI0026EA9E0D|nr:pilus assembly protein [Methyloversatilis discipulorum]MBV5284875.1 pilus assembly protein [Methyloversatilis discipulorum]
MTVHLHPRARQRGATLLIALVMLVVMTLLGLASIRSTSMQERMGANLYDRSLAFQAVESALREAEARISINTAVTNSAGFYCPPNGVPPSCAAPGPSATESATESETPSASSASYIERWKDPATTWASATTWWGSVDDDMKARLGGANRQPQYIIEYMGMSEDGTGCGQRGDTSCRGPRYRVTARMPPIDGLPNVVLQTNYRP